MARGSGKVLRVGEAHRLRAALASLDARERKILNLRYGLDGTSPHSLRQIGARLGISGERVRQLENRALARLGASDGTSAARWVRAAKAVSRPKTPMSREALEAWTLLLLRGRPAHGYELCQRLVERGFHRPGPRVYRLLRELERHDLVCSEWINAAAGPERRVYTLTSKGAHQLHADADSLQRRCETLRLFLEHYAEALDRGGSVAPTQKAIERSKPSASAPSALG